MRGQCGSAHEDHRPIRTSDKSERLNRSDLDSIWWDSRANASHTWDSRGNDDDSDR
jgi:hypothetical protein